jgi:uncharacterized protein (TIGR03435 family)
MKIALAAAVLTGVASLGAQAPLAFDAVSIRANGSGSRSGGVGPQGAGIRATNSTIGSLVRWAWELNSFELVGGPGWLDVDRSDIVATSAMTPDLPRTRAMTRAMLEERFALAVRRELRPMPVYALLPMREGRSLRAGLRASTTDCAAAFCGSRIDRGSVESRGITLDDFAKTMAGAAGRVIVDRTGFQGLHDIDLSFEPEPGSPGARTDVPSLFTALEEQLGLKLDPQTADVPVFVIEKIERPTPN